MLPGYAGTTTTSLKECSPETLHDMLSGKINWHWKNGDYPFGRIKFEDGWVMEPIEEAEAVGTPAP